MQSGRYQDRGWNILDLSLASNAQLPDRYQCGYQHVNGTAGEYQTLQACQPAPVDTTAPDWFAKSVEFAKTQKDWYSWNNSNWGTKWDVAVRDGDEYPNTELVEYKSEGDDNWLVYKYETAWSPAVTILTKLSNLVPNSVLTLEYEEETGWGGEYEIIRGEVKELAEWENRCYACQSFDTLSYCENDCGEFCSECNEGSWQDEEAMKECQTHVLLLESTEKVEA